MSDTLDPLVRDLVEWIAKEPRSHADVIDAWRTSCPRLTVWEEATERGYVKREFVAGRGAMVVATDAGRQLLGRDRRKTAMPAESTLHRNA